MIFGVSLLTSKIFKTPFICFAKVKFVHLYNLERLQPLHNIRLFMWTIGGELPVYSYLISPDTLVNVLRSRHAVILKI